MKTPGRRPSGMGKRALTVPSYAKINLGLEVLGRRSDGYHELRTIFQTIDLKDDVEVRPRREGFAVRCDHPGVPVDGSNLALRAATALAARTRLRKGALIVIRKRIPVARGLGGGSSNAAAVLMGLNALFGLGLGRTELQRIAAPLGADVPFFLTGGTALGIARGDEVYPLLEQLEAHVVVVDPGMPSSTAEVFSRLDAQLTPRENSNNIIRFISSDLRGGVRYRALVNELERAALQEAPELRARAGRIRERLVGAGAAQALMSGSGSSFFGVFEEAQAASKACAELRRAGFSAWKARTLSESRYRRAWLACLRGVRTSSGPSR